MTLGDDIIQVLSSIADPSLSQGMSDYMRGKFDFLGVTSPKRKENLKALYASSRKLSLEELIITIHQLWQQNERECQYAALDILIKNKKRLTSSDIEDVTHWITHKSWWDTVDALASHNVGALFEKDKSLRDQYVSLWLESDDIWLNRTCLIYQLKYKDQTDFSNLKDCILRLKHKDEFFIQKAIGWSLRQYSRFDATAVQSFVEEAELVGLAKREALRLLK